MKKIIFPLMILLISSCFSKEKKEVIEKKWFRTNNAFVIVCRGYPKEGVSGKARIETAKEAALINAQYFAKEMFNDRVDVVKNGTIEVFEVKPDYVVIRYVIKQRGLKQLVRNN